MKSMSTITGVAFTLSLISGSSASAQGPGPVGLRPVGTAPVHYDRPQQYDMRAPFRGPGMSGGERGAVIGALVGFVGGVAFALAHKGESTVTFGEGILFGFVLAVPGAVIGGLIGHGTGR